MTTILLAGSFPGASGIAAWSIVNNGAVTASGGNGFTPATGVAGGGGGGMVLTYTPDRAVRIRHLDRRGRDPRLRCRRGTAGTAGAAGTVLNVVLA